MRGLIPWFHDLKNGKRFYPDPLTLNVQTGQNDERYEKKYMWDLPRLQWATSLGEGYALTNDERYTRMFMAIMNDFLIHAPPGSGMPWINAMDNGIRVVNMLVLWSFFRKSNQLSDEFVIRFWQSIIEHLRACLQNAEDWPIEPPHPMAEQPAIRNLRNKGVVFRLRTNHFLGGRMGVWAALNALPDCPDIRHHREKARMEIEHEILAETIEDGMNFEASTQYHRLVCEMFFSWAMVCRNSRIPISSVALARFKKQFEFTRDITKPDGTIPQVGDMDNGRMHIFGYEDWRDHRYLTQLGACFFKDRSLLATGASISRYALWHFGTMATRYVDTTSKITLRSAVYPISGVAVLRSSNAYAAIFALKNGQAGAGGHSHEDKLAIEYSIGAKNIFVDPGQGTYAIPKKRAFFRSAQNHTVLTIDTEPINPQYPGYPWYVPDIAAAAIRRVSLNKRCVQTKHYGFAACKGKPYTRTVTLDSQGALIIRDAIPGNGVHTLTWRFALAPGMSARVRDAQHCVVIADHDGTQAVFYYPAGIDLSASVHKGLYAPEYGIDIPTQALTLSARQKLPHMSTFRIEPSSDLYHTIWNVKVYHGL